MKLSEKQANAIRGTLAVLLCVTGLMVFSQCYEAVTSGLRLDVVSWPIFIGGMVGFYALIGFMFTPWGKKLTDRDYTVSENTRPAPIQAACNDEVLKLAKERPPKCLNGFTVTLSETIPENSLTDFVFWQLQCPCGHDHFKMHGFRRTDLNIPDEKNFVPPITLSCDKCNRIIPVFNDNTDGYDAAIGFEYDHVEPREEKTLEYPMRIIAAFEYSESDDELDDDDFEGFCKNVPDYFTWIILYGSNNDEPYANKFDWECA